MPNWPVCSFFDAIDRINGSNFAPTSEDVLRSRKRTTGVVESGKWRNLLVTFCKNFNLIIWTAKSLMLGVIGIRRSESYRTKGRKKALDSSIWFCHMCGLLHSHERVSILSCNEMSLTQKDTTLHFVRMPLGIGCTNHCNYSKKSATLRSFKTARWCCSWTKWICSKRKLREKFL